VALAVVPHDLGEGLVLTTRASGLRAHAAQYALPGGMADPGETSRETVLRETEEEIGVLSSAWDVLDVLDDYSLGEIVITPFVLRAGTRPTFAPNPAEVSSVRVVPVPPRVPQLCWMTGIQQPGAEEQAMSARALPLGGFDLYAPTGAIVWQFLSWWIAGEVRRVADIAPPQFVRSHTST
jgi:8-oxo-dGTP pyrophosphatase MutT (NUDIX family)